MSLTEMQQKLLTELKNKPEQRFRASELAKAFNIEAKAVGCALSAMYRQRLINRVFIKGVSVWSLK